MVEPMLDPVGYPTIGWGSRYDLKGKEVTMQTPAITLEICDILLHRDVKGAERELEGLNINQNQCDALVSFIYNCGTGAFRGSTILKNIKSGAKVTESMFTAYCHARDQKTGLLVVLPGLLKRRKEEFALFSK